MGYHLLSAEQMAAVNAARSQVEQVESAFVQVESQLEARSEGYDRPKGCRYSPDTKSNGKVIPA
jgi:hypothetical protein|tara:strand:- start:337 stop:528 length:192 start_codon:yes stop_codon:yes gene_type:complete